MGMPLTTVLDHLKTMDSRGHLCRDRHPRDGRAVHISLTAAGVATFRRTHEAWEPMRKAFEEALGRPAGDIRAAVQAIDDAARSGLEAAELIGSRR
jgi:DNA-binding MarR family transcriptional regulator